MSRLPKELFRPVVIKRTVEVNEWAFQSLMDGKLFNKRSEAIAYFTKDSTGCAYCYDLGSVKPTNNWESAFLLYLPDSDAIKLAQRLLTFYSKCFKEPGWYIQAEGDDELISWHKFSAEAFKFIKSPDYVHCGEQVRGALKTMPDNFFDLK